MTFEPSSVQPTCAVLCCEPWLCSQLHREWDLHWLVLCMPLGSLGSIPNRPGQISLWSRGSVRKVARTGNRYLCRLMQVCCCSLISALEVDSSDPAGHRPGHKATEIRRTSWLGQCCLHFRMSRGEIRWSSPTLAFCRGWAPMCTKPLGVDTSPGASKLDTLQRGMLLPPSGSFPAALLVFLTNPCSPCQKGFSLPRGS